MDCRSVALLRVLLGLTTLYDLWDRSHDLYAHYSDWGVFPRFVSLEHYSHLYQFSLHSISGTTTFAAFMFLIHALIALLLVVGYRSQTMAILNWVMINSLISRCPPVTHGGDNYIKVVAFYSITLPLGACFSLDAVLSPNYSFNQQLSSSSSSSLSSSTPHQQQRCDNKRPSPYAFYSPTTFAYTLQIALIYVMGFFHKTGDDWVVTRNATYYALSMSFFRRPPLGDLMILFPTVLKLMTVAVLWWEGVGPLLFVAPVYRGPLRTFAAIGFSLMHLGFGLCMRLDEFIYIGMSAPLCLLPSWFWDTILLPFLRRRLTSLGDLASPSTAERTHNDYSDDDSADKSHRKKSNSRIEIVYTASVPHFELNAKLACTFLLLPHTYKVYDASTFDKSQQQQQQNDRCNNVSSPQASAPSPSSSMVWMIVDVNGSKQYGYNAFVTLCKASPVLSWIPTRLLRVALVRSALWFFYDLFLNAYYSLYNSSWSSDPQTRKRLFSKKSKEYQKRHGGIVLESPLLDRGVPLRRLFVNAVVISSIVFLVAWNLSYIEVTKMEDYPAVVNEIGYLLQLDQGVVHVRSSSTALGVLLHHRRQPRGRRRDRAVAQRWHIRVGW